MSPALRSPFAGVRDMARATGWPRHLLASASVVTTILVLFVRDVIGMIGIWWTSSTYGHCLFIPFLIAWLVHQRLDVMRQLRPQTWLPALLWLAGGALCWLLGDAGGLAVLRHASIVIMLQGAVAAILGRAVTKALLFPLFYAFFMIPVGSELEPALQLLTAKIATALLSFANVPAHIDGIFITIPNGYFKVAEACSGAKFLVAMAAYAVLVCNVCFRSWARRALFLAFALAACIFANGVRAFATIYVAHRTSTDAAVGFDHVVYGWFFFAFVIIAIMAAAWPFFDRKPGDAGIVLIDAKEHDGPQWPLAAVLLAGLALIIAPPSWSRLSAACGEAALAPLKLPAIAGWTIVSGKPGTPWKPRFDGTDMIVQGRYADGRGHLVDLAIAVFARQFEGHELIAFGQGAADPDSDWSWSSPASAPANGRGEIITAPGPINRHVVTFYRVGDSGVTGDITRVKFDTMKARLMMTNQKAVAILISAEDREGARADDAISALLNAMGDPKDLADAAARNR